MHIDFIHLQCTIHEDRTLNKKIEHFLKMVFLNTDEKHAYKLSNNKLIIMIIIIIIIIVRSY